MDIYEKNKITEDFKNISKERWMGIYYILITALKFNMSDIIYNIICEWKWVDILCNTLDDDNLLKILEESQKCKDFKIHLDWNNPSIFCVHDNVRDIFVMNDRLDIVELFCNNKDNVVKDH